MNTHSNQNNSLSIIVIEDNRGDFILVEDYLIENYKEIKVEQCTSFESAKIYLQNKNNLCDLIFLDLNVTDMEGLELVKSMATLSAKIPIIILTGYADLPLAKKSLELGIYDFLIKDEINPTLLHKSIEFAISRSKYVHEIESQYEKLRKIAWTQSHVVRAPLARILGIISVIDTVNIDNKELPFWLENLKTSTLELDEIIHKIVHEAQPLINKK